MSIYDKKREGEVGTVTPFVPHLKVPKYFKCKKEVRQAYKLELYFDSEEERETFIKKMMG